MSQIRKMAGVQLSAAWAIAQAAESLAASSDRELRQAGRSSRCCEVVALDRVPERKRRRGSQGVQVSLRFYRQDDLDAVAACLDDVEVHVARAFGLWGAAVQLDLDLVPTDEPWLGINRPSTVAGTGLRLDRYLTGSVLAALEERRGLADWRYLAEHKAEVRILLRRLRYRLGQDYGAKIQQASYAYWTTATTSRWAKQHRHQLNYLVHRLSCYADDLTPGDADPASSLDTGYWGEVDTEKDPLRVKQMTTGSGTTAPDVQAVLAHAGAQIDHLDKIDCQSDRETNRVDPLKPFIDRLDRLIGQPRRLRDVDVLLIHRGGGVNPVSRWDGTNVPDVRRREFFDLCLEVRDMGVEVVVALGHANISVLNWADREERHLPLGIFEATTPTAGAAWILQEHINPRLVDTALIYGQELAT